MVPRTEITAVDISESIENLRDFLLIQVEQKLLYIKIILMIFWVMCMLLSCLKNLKTIKSIIIPVGFVPETILIKDVLNILTKKRRSMAVVIDEYGGTSGIMTVEDIIEELFGEIEDEHDTIEMIEEQLADNTYKIFSKIRSRLYQ